MSNQLWWYVARSSGIVSLLLLGATVLWGLLSTTRVLAGRPSPQWLMTMHQFLGGLAVVFTGLHITGLVMDSYIGFGPTELLVPFTSTYRPAAVALGVVALYLLAAIESTSLLMRRMPRRWWRAVHASSWVLLWLAVVHGATAGSDASRPAYIVGSGTLILLTMGLSAYRVTIGRRARRAVAPIAPRAA